MNRIISIHVAAIIMAASLTFFSCSSGGGSKEEDTPSSSSATVGNILSSSSVAVKVRSSSSVEQTIPSSSSEQTIPSSSSEQITIPSSSSAQIIIIPSSSSAQIIITPSSSSVQIIIIPSSSSVQIASSSSVAGTPSSSSLKLSSSSLAGNICGVSIISNDNYFCLDNVVTAKCNGETFPSGKFCDEGQLYNRCGGDAYYTDRQFCLNGVVTSKCGGSGGETYTTAQMCHYGKVKDYFTDTRNNEKYPIVTIGSQTWMAKNLYNANGGINTICYDRSSANCAKYGYLYTWEAANTCPSGWRLPSRADWQTLINYVGASSAGTKLKAASPDWDGTDDYGFAALPSGYRTTAGDFGGLGNDSYWWTADKDLIEAWSLYMGTYRSQVGAPGISNMSNQYSVRCVK